MNCDINETRIQNSLIPSGKHYHTVRKTSTVKDLNKIKIGKFTEKELQELHKSDLSLAILKNSAKMTLKYS